jgi:peptide/nickel transport system substrate-binding protein
MVVSDEAAVFPAVERLLDAGWNEDATSAHYVGVLAESWDIDPVAKTFTFHLRKNVKFFDGSDMTADVVAWNIQLFKDNGRLQQASFLDSIEVKDQYTVVLHFNQYNNEFDFNWGWLPIFSKQAWDNAGTTDEERIAYFTDHIVATGPFMVGEYKRDDHLTWVKNPNYWQPGKPYLDKINVVFIPDSVAASAMMEKGDADMWLGGSPTDWQTLEKKGILRKAYWGVLVADLVPNTVDSESVWQDIRVREALEYAINKDELAQAIGKGYYTAMYSQAPIGVMGYDPNGLKREYDPAKAKQLLADAGYPNGLPIELLITNDSAAQDQGTLIKGYLDAAGFQCTLDIADFGRYASQVYGSGWKDLITSISAVSVNQDADFMAWFGYQPRSILASFDRMAPDLVALEKAEETESDMDKRIEMTKQMYNYLVDQALVISLYSVPFSYMLQPWVQGCNYLKGGPIRWATEDLWIQPH